MSPVDDRLKRGLEGSYAVLQELGRGATSTVYLAEDLKHRRQVAIKVLHPEIGSLLGTDRFRREIDISAHLEHPHILTLIDSGDAEGLLYYVMPRVEGESLDDRLEREKRIPISEAVQIARDVADGLAYAHARDVIHRDVKPANILLTGTHALIADFGIAKALSETKSGKVTQTGVTVGSPAYMSPEQVLGAQDLDGRTDIYSLGCVLYEMIAGRTPTEGSTMAAIFAHRMSKDPPPLSEHVDGVPAEVERAVQRALAKDPDDRFDTADQFAAALAGADLPPRLGDAVLEANPRGSVWLRVVSVLVLAVVAGVLIARAGRLDNEAAGDASSLEPGRAAATSVDATDNAGRIAILPFEDDSEDASLGYLGSGFTRALINRLTQVEALNVVSYNGVRPFRGSTAAPDSIGRALRAGILVAGGVDASSGFLRVHVSLIDAATGLNLASRTVERPRGEAFELQDDLTLEISDFLREELGEEIRVRTRKASTTSLEAWELVQRAEDLRENVRPLLDAGDPTAASGLLLRVDSVLARAEGYDPEWLEPIVMRGWVAERRARLDAEEPGAWDPDRLRTGLGHAERALELAPESAEALELRGTLRYRLWMAGDASDASELAAAEQDLRQAVSSDADRARAWSSLSDLLQFARQEFAEAKVAAENAYEADPFLEEAEEILSRLQQATLDAGEYEEARRWAREGRRRFPDVVDFVAAELILLTLLPPEPMDGERAWALADTIVAHSPPHLATRHDRMAKMQVVMVLGRGGLADSARAVLVRTRAAADDPEAIAYEEAAAWLAIGDEEQSLSALRTHLTAYPEDRTYLTSDTWFEALWDDPRFQELVGTTE